MLRFLTIAGFCVSLGVFGGCSEASSGGSGKDTSAVAPDALDSGITAPDTVENVDVGAEDAASGAVDAGGAQDIAAASDIADAGASADVAAGADVADADVGADVAEVADGGDASGLDDVADIVQSADIGDGAGADDAHGDTQDGGGTSDDAASTPDASTQTTGPLPADGYASTDPKTCDAGDGAWVARAMLVLMGRRPRGAHELQLWLDVTKALGRKKTALAMMHHPGYYRRWTDWITDSLLANRTGFRHQPVCFGNETWQSQDAVLAKFIRDNPATKYHNAPNATMRDVIGSALRLDDLTPAWRANVFAAIVRARMYCVNTGVMGMEKVRRRDFAERFARVYTHRTAECAGCHNSAYSVNDDPDPQKDLFWPMPGHFEKSVFGAHSMAPVVPWQAMFRRLDLVTTPASAAPGLFKEPDVKIPLGAFAVQPFGLHKSCGEMIEHGKVAKDPLDEAGDFLGYKGKAGSVWDVEAGLREGIDKLRKEKLGIDPKTQEIDSKKGLAWMMSARIAHQLWLEVMGRPLTVSHGFARNKAQRDKLQALTELLVAEQWSLRAILAGIVTDPLFNRAPPAAGCDTNPYVLPRLFNPWSTAEPDKSHHPNTVGDATHNNPARALLSATYDALDWTPGDSFADVALADFEAEIGAFSADGKPGFNGTHFQSLLAWENRFGACRPHVTYSDLKPGASYSKTSCAGRCGVPVYAEFTCFCDATCAVLGDCCQDMGTVCEAKFSTTGDDFVDKLAKHAAAQKGATVGELARALKDRLLLEGDVDPTVEAALIATVFGVPSLQTKLADAKSWKANARVFCGALLTTPQFLLVGLAAPKLSSKPALTLPGDSYQELCEARSKDTLTPAGWKVTCAAGSVTLK